MHQPTPVKITNRNIKSCVQALLLDKQQKIRLPTTSVQLPVTVSENRLWFRPVGTMLAHGLFCRGVTSNRWSSRAYGKWCSLKPTIKPKQ